MKILFFLQFPNPFPGAGWTRISFFSQYLSSKGHDIAIGGSFSATSLDKAGYKKWNNLQLYNITPVIMTHNFFSLIFNIISSFLSSAILLIWLRPQLVIISVPNGESAFGAYLIAKMFRKHIVTDYRDLWEDYMINRIKSKFYKKFYNLLKVLMARCYKNSDHVITVTSPLAHNLTLRGVNNVQILTNGADTNIFKPYDKTKSRQKIGCEKHDFVLVYNGMIGDYYRLDILVRALKKIVNKIATAKLLILGYGPDLKNIMDLSEELGLINHVFYVGVKSDVMEVAEILSAADVGVIPYGGDPRLNDSLPVKGFEYFACGLPVVATCYSDSLLSKMIIENEIGLASQPEDVDALADALQKIHDDKSFREKAGARARLLVEEKFDRNKIAEQFLNLIKC